MSREPEPYAPCAILGVGRDPSMAPNSFFILLDLPRRSIRVLLLPRQLFKLSSDFISEVVEGGRAGSASFVLERRQALHLAVDSMLDLVDLAVGSVDDAVKPWALDEL